MKKYFLLKFNTYSSKTNIFEFYQNALTMRIALVHQTHANLMFVTVGQKTNALEQLIHVQPENANVVRRMNVPLQKFVLLGNALVSKF